ncbi:MAG: DUF6503 family protein [Cyclobacteriaceae bacterium]
MIKVFLTVIIMSLAACSSSDMKDPQKIIDRSIQSHGFDKLHGKAINFKFRKKFYSVRRYADRYVYTSSFANSTGAVEDRLVNSTELSRTVNGNQVTLTKKSEGIITEAINSVLYFFQLPYGLNDAAVNKKYEGTTTIDGTTYYLVGITFGENGGGKDFQDEYLYWVNTNTYLVDFLAYNYIVNEGGVRFRKAINRKTIDGLTFQDYINYKPVSKSTPLKSLGRLYEKGELQELSRIVSEGITVSDAVAPD